MIVDRNDFTKTLEARHNRQRAEMMPMIRLLASAKPVMESLVVDERWTRYQQALQGLIEKWKAQRELAKERLGSTGLGDVDLRKLNADVVAANAAISAWELAIQLPAAIAKGGEEAVSMVIEWEKKNEIPATAQAQP